RYRVFRSGVKQFLPEHRSIFEITSNRKLLGLETPDLDSLLSKSEGDFNRVFVYELCLNIVELECLSRDSSMTYDIKLYFTFQLRSFLALEVFIATETVSRAIRANTIGITTAPARAWNMNSDELLAPLVIQLILLIFCGEGGLEGGADQAVVARADKGASVVSRGHMW